MWQDYLDLYEYWKVSPPTHILVAGFVGHKPPTEIAKDVDQSFALEELMSMFPTEIVPKEKMPNVG